MLGGKQGCGAPKVINCIQGSDSRFMLVKREKDITDCRNQAKKTK
jgi:hypothetical protein